MKQSPLKLSMVLACQLFAGMALAVVRDDVPVAPNLVAALGREENMLAALQAFTSSCQAKQIPKSWQATCAKAQFVDNSEQARAFIAREFVASRVPGAGQTDANGIATGYFVPEFRASLNKTANFAWPLYGPPEGYVGNRRYPSRKDMEDGEQKLPVVAWVATPNEAYRVGVQGSGRIRLEDGRVLNLEFAGTNGQPFKGLTGILQEAQALPPGAQSLASVERFLASKTLEQVSGWIRENPRLTFFRLAGKGNISGTVQMASGLVAGRSCAVDPTLIPLGALVAIDTVLPATNTPITLMCGAHDTGGAIQGAHIDVYFGVGDGAGAFAGAWYQRARLWMLVPRDSAVAAGDYPAK